MKEKIKANNVEGNIVVLGKYLGDTIELKYLSSGKNANTAAITEHSSHDCWGEDSPVLLHQLLPTPGLMCQGVCIMTGYHFPLLVAHDKAFNGKASESF